MADDTKTPRLKDVDEVLAREAVTAGLGVPARRTDVPPHQCMWDLEAEYADGRRIAAEVVSTRDREAQRLSRATLDRGHVTHPELRRVWGVSVAPTAVVKRLVQALPVFLVRLEAEHVDKVSASVYGPWWNEMKQMRIDLCWSSPQNDLVRPGYRLFPRPTGAFEKDIDAAVRRANGFIADGCRDKIEKLQASSADERHIVILVDETWLDVEGEIRNGTALPTIEPNLPRGLDGVWLVALWGGPTRAVYWIRGKGWQHVNLDEWRPHAWRPNYSD